MLATGLLPAGAQTVKFGGEVQHWYTQMLDSDLRHISSSVAPNAYYNLRSVYRENSLTLRRAEIKATGKITEGVE